MNIGICGIGTVGSGVLSVLQRNLKIISSRAGSGISVTHIASRSLKSADKNIKVSNDVFSVANDPEVDIVVELIGGYDVALDLVLKAISNGKHVVTANKALIAVHGNTIFKAAEDANVLVKYEASVAGGIPIVKARSEGLSANSIEWLAGIINGTGNYILTEMRDKGRAFEDVLIDAQKLGYAEADPTFDVEGIDAAHKLVILSSLAFGIPLNFDACYTEGISSIKSQDIKYAEELGYQIKHLGITRKTNDGIEMRVHPTLIPKDKLIANVDGVMNAVLIKGDAVGPSLFYGAGAGAEPTASSVIADIVDIIRACSDKKINPISHLSKGLNSVDELQAMPIDDIDCSYYLRIDVDDKPGVLYLITHILSEKGISIEAVLQKEIKNKSLMSSADYVAVVLITNKTKESTFNSALKKIQELESVVAKVTTIRVESLD